MRKHRFEFCERRLLEDQKDESERVIWAYSDESYCHANHVGKSTWGLSEEAWQEAIMQDASDRAERGESLDVSSVSLAGLAEGGSAGGEATVRVVKPKSGKGNRAVIVDAISEYGRIMRTDPDTDTQVPVGKIWPAHVQTGDYHGNFNSLLYLRWMLFDLLPGLLETSKANGDRPVNFCIDHASYHASMGPTGVNVLSLKKNQLVELCQLFDVTEEDLDRCQVPKMANSKGGNDAPKVGENRKKAELAAFCLLLMPQERNQLQVLWACETKNRPHAERWCLDYEPSYHFELQATEHLWGIIKNMVAREPRYNLKEVIVALRQALVDVCTPKLCASLVNECRRFQHVFYKADVLVYGPGGEDEVHSCASSCCPHAVFMARSGPRGEAARAAPLFQCKGPCGFYYHEQCAMNDDRGVWNTNDRTCHCGCADGGDDGSVDGESDDETAPVESEDDEITDLTVDYDDDRHSKRVQAEVSAYNRALRLKLSGRDDRVQAMAGGKSGGATSNFNSSHR